MNINTRAKNLEVTPSLQQFIEKKLGSLSRFIKPMETEGLSELSLLVARTTAHHQKGEVFQVSADLRMPKKILRASEKHADVRVAIDLVKRKLHLEIGKYKTRFSEPKKSRNK